MANLDLDNDGARRSWFWNLACARGIMSWLRGLLHGISLLITASAAVILFIAVPFDLLDNWHMLPSSTPWGVVFLFFPLVYVWGHAGLYLLVAVTACESTILFLKPVTTLAKITAAVPILVCLLTYLLLYLSVRFNIH